MEKRVVVSLIGMLRRKGYGEKSCGIPEVAYKGRRDVVKRVDVSQKGMEKAKGIHRDISYEIKEKKKDTWKYPL